MTRPAHPLRVDSVEADVCLVVEGCYPYVAGGVSAWLDWLMRSLPHLSFTIVAIVAEERTGPLRYALPPNVVALERVALSQRPPKPVRLAEPRVDPTLLADLLSRTLRDGDPAAFADLCRIADQPHSRLQLLDSRAAWSAMTDVYHRMTPHASFPDFFWAWRTLVGGLIAVLKAPLPKARCYHAISTGYAGLFAARAALATGRPAAITEHGIYTNERRIDLTMAEWIPDSIALSLAQPDDRSDLRQFWIAAFEAYAKLCYAACTRITTLYGENQTFQLGLGAAEDRLEVIPNGIRLDKFEALRPRPGRPPTVALIGRVVPIKDIKTFIAAIARLRADVPDLRALLIGPTDEDEDYHAQCLEMVRDLGLQDVLTFTGKVDIMDYLPEIDVLALTSISEAQPLVLLEAGAASIPCVTTDVGSCREIIEGLPDERPKLGPAGRVVRPMDPHAVAEALRDLLLDPDLRAACGARLRERVRLYFTSEASSSRYDSLYRRMCAR